ncbi:MAG: hypothetical protein EOM87_06610 [Clostridia bacterium]|nr:hypothetical protein [Clostridia bacterium]
MKEMFMKAKKFEPIIVCYDVNIMHSQIEKLLGKSVRITVLSGNRPKILEGVMVFASSKIFGVELILGDSKIKATYTYTDLFIKKVIIEEIIIL